MQIFHFAKVANWEERLGDLSRMAEPERWTNQHLSDRSHFPVLSLYIRYTFKRVYDQQKIIIADRVACFNTGLLTDGHEEIFGVFIISENYDSTKSAALCSSCHQT